MTPFRKEVIDELLAVTQKPCLSLYQPTHRHFPENQQDPIRFRNLVKQLKDSLRQSDEESATDGIFELLESLAHDSDFWNCTLDGLAVLAAPGFFRVLRLPKPMPELALVADSFYVKPLWRLLQHADRYQVLALTRGTCRLYEGTSEALHEVKLSKEVPQTLTEALGEQLTQLHQASYGGVNIGATYHSGGDKHAEVDKDTERFFRAVDRGLVEHYSRPSGLPLILAALGEHHHLFQRISHNPFLMKQGIAVDPSAVNEDELRMRAWEVLKPQYEQRLAELSNDFEAARSKGLASDDPAEVAAAAAAGRVRTLLLELDRQIPGTLDTQTGEIEIVESNDRAGDLLDDVGELVAKMGGEVLVVPREKMSARTGVAGIYRY